MKMIFFILIQMKFVFFLLGFLTSLGHRVLRLGRSLGRCCVELHYGTVLGTQFDPVSLATSSVISNKKAIASANSTRV